MLTLQAQGIKRRSIQRAVQTIVEVQAGQAPQACSASAFVATNAHRSRHAGPSPWRSRSPPSPPREDHAPCAARVVRGPRWRASEAERVQAAGTHEGEPVRDGHRRKGVIVGRLRVVDSGAVRAARARARQRRPRLAQGTRGRVPWNIIQISADLGGVLEIWRAMTVLVRASALRPVVPLLLCLDQQLQRTMDCILKTQWCSDSMQKRLCCVVRSKVQSG